MANILGIDLGGTSLDYVLATENGEFLYKKSYPSPFKETAKRLPDGSPEVFIDTILHNIPAEHRTYTYIAQTEAEFLNEADGKTGNINLEKKGYSLCGKTWEHDGKIYIIGGNTPLRFAEKAGKGKIGIAITGLKPDYQINAANDGNAAATAQGIYYKAVKGINPVETGYLILGTGFGFGVPGYSALTELGHIPVGFIPKLLWQYCGCTDGQKTACAENYAAGRGIKRCAEILLSSTGDPALSLLAEYSNTDMGIDKLIATSRLRNCRDISAETVMDLAKDNSDGLAAYIADLAAEITAYAAVTAAQLFGLQRIGIGESVARCNPWHVNNIAKKVNAYTRGNTILRPVLRVEATPLKDPAKYGALSLVVPESRYDSWAERMEKS